MNKNEGSEMVPYEAESALHPDMQAAVESILHNEIPNYVRWGSVGHGLNKAAKNFAEILAASNATLSESGKEHFLSEVTTEVVANLNEGLLSAIENVAKFTQWGIDSKGPFAEIKDLCALAREMSIQISVVPEKQGDNEGEASLLKPLTTEEEVLQYCNDQIERNLLKGVEGHLDSLSDDVAKGRLDLSRFDKDMEKWMGTLQARGFEIVDEPIEKEIDQPDITVQGILLRRINKAEIAKIKEEVIASKLAEGFEALVKEIQYKISHGQKNPLKDFEEAKDDYIAEAESRGLTDRKAKTLRNGSSFNPDLVEPEIEKIIRQNIADGLENLTRQYYEFIREGQIEMISYFGETLEQYLAMAKKHNIVVENEAEIRQFMTEAISAENLQAGVMDILKKAQQWTREGDLNLVKSLVRKVDSIRKFAHDKGLDGQIDFTPFDSYITAINLNNPALPQS